MIIIVSSAIHQLENMVLQDTVKLAKTLAEKGDIDLNDISSGGSHPAQKSE